MIFLSIILMYSALQCAVSTVFFLQRMQQVIRRGTWVDRFGIAFVTLINVVAIITLTAVSIGINW